MFAREWVMSEVTATILSAIIGAVVGGVFVLAGVWVGYYFSKRASEGDRHAELHYTIYRKIEQIKNLLMAFKKKMISQETLLKMEPSHGGNLGCPYWFGIE